MLPRAQPAGSLCSLLPRELRGGDGGGRNKPPRHASCIPGDHAFLPPCLSLAINYFRLTKSALLLSCSQSSWWRSGSLPGNPQHPQSPEDSGQLGQRKLGNWVTSWAPTSWGTQRVGLAHSTGQSPRAPLPKNCARGKEKWLGGQASMCLRVQQEH